MGMSTSTAKRFSDLEATTLTYSEKWHIINTNLGQFCPDCAICGTLDTLSASLKAEFAQEERAIANHEGRMA